MLRSAPLLRRGALLIRVHLVELRMSPGSAEQRKSVAPRPGHESYRTVTGAGSGGTTVGCVPGTPDICAGAAPAGPGIGCADAVVVPGGGPPGNTTTRVPTLTRSNRSETSSLSMPMQPEETNLPIVEGWLVPWMR